MAIPVARGRLAVLPPLALYVHVPWCLRKCPYCDFNSHAPRDGIPESAYLDCLLRDLVQEVSALPFSRPLTSVFIGGGTPSLLAGMTVDRLLRGIGDLMDLPANTEITLEANPGAADADRFAGYREAGVNRLSIGVQSLSSTHLERIGRIHDPEQVYSAVGAARQAGFRNLNLDLMYGLPEQSLVQARRDLEQALALQPEHISYYQLTLEPGTAFYQTPPPLPDEDLIADMHRQGVATLASKGFVQYEVSAYARAGYRCRHNLNYWEFGDYLGIGAGAHGKLTERAPDRIERRWKLRHPRRYLDPANADRLIDGKQRLSDPDLMLEFAMNALRLLEGFSLRLFEERTGLASDRIADRIENALSAGMLTRESDRVWPTELGRRFLDDLVALFG